MPNTIGIIPQTRYRRADKHSQKSIEWLLYYERDIGREIVHAGRTRGFRLPDGQLVDLLTLPKREQQLRESFLNIRDVTCTVARDVL